MSEIESGKKSNLPYLTLLIVQLCFGSLPVTGKIVMQVLPAMSVVGFRVGVTALVLLALQTYKGNLALENKKDYLQLFFLSFIGITLNQIFFITGLSLTKASNAALLAVTIPIFTLIISTFLGIEKLRSIKVLGIILAAIGVLFLINPAQASFSNSTIFGDFLIILNSLAYGIFVVFSKDVFTRNGAIKSTAWIFGFAAIICVPLGLFSLSSLNITAIESKIWWLTAHISLICTVVPYLFVAWSIPRVNPSTVAVFVYLQPLFGFCLAVFFLGEQFTVLTILAAMLIFAGVFLATKKRKVPVI